MIYFSYALLAYLTYLLGLGASEALHSPCLTDDDAEDLRFELLIQTLVWATLAWLIFFK